MKKKVILTDLTTDKPKTNYTINTLTEGENPCAKVFLDPSVSDTLFQLEYCDRCIQMTNHRNKVCQKCKTTLTGVVDEGNGVRERISVEFDMGDTSIEQQKMIAKFMEINVRDFKWKVCHRLAICESDGEIDFMECGFYEPRTDWNQLMQVVAKMEKLGYAMTIDPWSVEVIEYLSGKRRSRN